MLSGSSIERAMLCVASAVLVKVDRKTQAAREGTQKHQYIGAMLALRPDDAVAGMTLKQQEKMRAIDLAPLAAVVAPGVDGVEDELAIAYDVDLDEAVALPGVKDRNYPELSPSVIPMTLDLVSGNRLIEIKTGRTQVAPPHSNWQIKAESLGLARARGLSTVKAHLAQAIGATWRIEAHAFGAFDLDCIAEDLRALNWRVRAMQSDMELGVVPDVSPGDEQCRYCDCKPNCSAWTNDVAVSR